MSLTLIIKDNVLKQCSLDGAQLDMVRTTVAFATTDGVEELSITGPNYQEAYEEKEHDSDAESA